MRVLVIEDEYKIAHAIKRFLTKESFAVDVAPDGEEGLNTALSEAYDLIILDRMLPSMEGVVVCRELRKAGHSVPILMLTAKDQVGQRVEGLNAGADDYLVKPFSLEELLARIRALLRRPHDAVGEVLVVGDLTLDTTTKQVQRQNQSITLSPKEYALLEYFMRNPGRILSKHNLIAHVWDFDANILPSSVESFIMFLRTKIDKPFAGPQLIHTVRGFGYKIDVSET
jgi:DNA-binding response OmpR family regulator